MSTSSAKLARFYSALLDDWDELEAELLAQIAQPEDTDTHRLSLLLEALPRPVFLQPVLSVLARSEQSDPWTLNYLYAAAQLLKESEDGGMAPEGLKDRLIDWVLHYQSVTSWYASGVLCYFTDAAAEEAMLQKVMANDDFHLTLASCIWGLLGINREKYGQLIAQLAEDETYDLHFRETCQRWLHKEADGLNQ